MKTITLYTDGACSGNPGPGGWGAILEWEGHEKELSGGEISTTNNRMELTGVIRGLEALKEPCIVELYSDSKYVIDALEKGWAASWQKRGWVKSDKKPALNPDLWQRLLELCQVHQVRCHWVKGHAENPKNNRCDELAVAQWKRLKGERAMYLPIGNDMSVRERSIVGIFDLDNTSTSKRTREFLEKSEELGEVVPCDDLPKSFVLTSEYGFDRVYLTALNAATLEKRLK